MSLITLNSNGQKPSFFSCHFPQPIKIAPYSQVCLLKFLHFRDTHVYNITTSNNRLLFCIGNTTFDGIRQVVISPGQYSGPELAAEITAKMNDVLQQQHYQWTCTFTPEDDTTSPPTLESFTIAYASLPTPALAYPEQADVVQLDDFLDFDFGPTALRVDLTTQAVAELPAGYTQSYTVQVPKGLLTNDGVWQSNDIRFSGADYDLANVDAIENFAFDDKIIGFCRDSLRSLSNDNPNLLFDPTKQDVVCRFNEDGLNISSIKIAGNTSLGQPGYATATPCRLIPSSAFKDFCDNESITTAQLPQLNFQLIITLNAVGRRVICQLYYRIGNAARQAVPDGSMGQDPKGKEYVSTFTNQAGDVFPGCIWISDNADKNDYTTNGAGQEVSNRVQNILATKNCPFVPTASFLEVNTRIAAPDLTTDQLQYEDAGGNDATFEDYTGSNGYTYKLTIIGDATEYYLKERTGLYADVYTFDMSTSDVPFAGNGKAEFDPDTDAITITLNGGGAGPVLQKAAGSPSPDSTFIENVPLFFQSILNPEFRPLSLANSTDAKAFQTDLELHQKFYGVKPDPDAVDASTDLGADVARQAMLFLRQLNTADIAQYSGAPANLKQGQRSGTIGSTIGSTENIIVGASASEDQTLFTSGQATQRIAKDTILTISVPELAGVKSYNGIDQGAGRLLSGEAKNIAVLPREEFETRGENVNGSLVYVAPFENWIDLNNGAELTLNQLSCEVRQPGGQVANDLRPDTICQIKFRQDPLFRDKLEQDERYERLVLALSSAAQTGQILSQNMYQTGS